MQAPCGPAPCQSQPYGPAPQSVVTAPPASCGCNSYAGHSYGSTCYDCGYGSTHVPSASCNCGGTIDAYGGVVTDPYLSGGQIVGDTVVGGQSYPPAGVPVQSDNFDARKFDTDGNRITWEEPLPQGTMPAIGS